MLEAEFRATIAKALRSFGAATEQAIRNELARPFDLGDSGCLQFEIDPSDYRVHLVQTENNVVSADSVFSALPVQAEEAAERAGLDVNAILADEFVHWLSARWRAAGGPEYHRPAYAYFHGGLSQPRFDLERRRWFKVADVWPELK